MASPWRLAKCRSGYRRAADWQLVTPDGGLSGGGRRYGEGCDNGDIIEVLRDNCDSGEGIIAAVNTKEKY